MDDYGTSQMASTSGSDLDNFLMVFFPLSLSGGFPYFPLVSPSVDNNSKGEKKSPLELKGIVEIYIVDPSGAFFISLFAFFGPPYSDTNKHYSSSK